MRKYHIGDRVGLVTPCDGKVAGVVRHHYTDLEDGTHTYGLLLDGGLADHTWFAEPELTDPPASPLSLETAVPAQAQRLLAVLQLLALSGSLDRAVAFSEHCAARGYARQRHADVLELRRHAESM